MLKKHILTLTFISIAALSSFAQNSNELDTAALRKAVQDTISPEGYKTLLRKFNEAPQYLYANEGAVLYYGKLFQKGPDPFQRIAAKKTFNELMLQKRFNEAIIEGERLAKADPVDLKLLVMLMAAYIEIKKEAGINLTKAKLQLLSNAILSKGKGDTDSTTLKVTSVEDEYTVMAMLKLNGKSRRSESRINSNIDHWTIITKDDSKGWGFVEDKNRQPEDKESSLYVEVLRPY
ncbi:DUF4919 domain-containing protein [Niabella yanshanensis]|uniref:DUF4919 domain-containing protein n=1 Tax=Niabella yanshanensis TaxID=577386 RepID=A0ABZ0W957_9BACT|nr:DUF4919 domain-containing protein [Niabella yanshanensis]WQD39489.1 DUF4919 domain-containing protein [Niabella yanshanensis]